MTDIISYSCEDALNDVDEVKVAAATRAAPSVTTASVTFGAKWFSPKRRSLHKGWLLLHPCGQPRHNFVKMSTLATTPFMKSTRWRRPASKCSHEQFPSRDSLQQSRRSTRVSMETPLTTTEMKALRAVDDVAATCGDTRLQILDAQVQATSERPGALLPWQLRLVPSVSKVGEECLAWPTPGVDTSRQVPSCLTASPNATRPCSSGSVSSDTTMSLDHGSKDWSPTQPPSIAARESRLAYLNAATVSTMRSMLRHQCSIAVQARTHALSDVT